MQTVYILSGLPGCGKSTWARRKAKGDMNTAIVCRDDLRSMFKGEYVFDVAFEPAIVEMAQAVMDILLLRGFDVIIDETNLTKRCRTELIDHLHAWCKIAWGGYPHVPLLRIVCVQFPEDRSHVQRRIMEHRGYSPGKWIEVIEGMKKTREIVSMDEGFSEILTISDPNNG